MIKALSLFASLLMLTNISIEGQVSTTINTSASTPTIDGANTDPIWSTLPENTIDRVFSGETIDDADDLSGHWKALYDDDGIYILVEVTADDILYTSAGNFWENDLIELCFDMNVGDLTDGQGIQHNDGHYQLFINRESLVEVISDPGTWKDGVHVGVSLNSTDNTSIHEYFVPWANIPSGSGTVFTPNTSDQIGFDISITDNDDDGTGRNRMAWGNDGANDENWNNMDDAGRLSFGTSVSPSIGMADDGSIVEGSEDGEVITITLSNDTFVSTLNPSNWSISNQPSGVSLGTVTRVDETTVTITLSGNTNVDYDTEINNFSVEVSANELTTSTDNLIISGGVSFTPKYKAPRSYRIEYDGEILEGEEDGELVSVILTSCEYVDSPDIKHWNFYNFPQGVVAENLIRTNDTTVTFTLSGNAAVDYDNDITEAYIRLQHFQLKDTISLPKTDSRITFTANKERNLSLHEIDELFLNNEDGAELLVIVENDSLNNTITPENWQLTGVPAEISIQSIEKISSNRAIITLAGNSTAQTAYQISITATADEFYQSTNSLFSAISLPIGIHHVHNIDVSEAHSMNDEIATEYLIDQCYEILRWKMGSTEQHWGASFYMLANIASEYIVKGGESENDLQSYKGIDSLSIKPDNTAIQALWEKYFTGIIRCNTLLEHIEPGTANTNRLISEAKFLRAYFYFHLVRVYGGVPLIYSSCHTPFTLPVRNTSSEVYDFIKLELASIIDDLPYKSALNTIEKARITKGAAQTLLAKANLYTQNWGDVTTTLDAVITSGEYNLLANYDSLWFQNKEHNEESIFEIEYTDTLPAEWDGASEPGNVDVQFMGIRSLNDNDGIYSSGWGFCKVTSEMVSNFITANDTIRLQASVLFADSIDGTLEDDYDYTGYYNKKYAARTQFAPRNSTMWGQNEVKYRYAEVLLMYAEASYHLSNESDALTYLNIVRTRVNLPSISGVSGQALLDTIYAERRLEMAFESNRYFDVVRWGKTEEAFAGENYNPATNGLWPIPEKVFENSAIFTQNPGYDNSTALFHQEIQYSGYADRSYSPQSTKPYINREYKIDSVVNYGLSTCSAHAEINAKTTYHYTNDTITSEQVWRYDKVNQKWLNTTQYSYEYDAKGNLHFVFEQGLSDYPFNTGNEYLYDDNNYLKESTFYLYTYGDFIQTQYIWNNDYTSYREIRRYSSLYAPESTMFYDSSFVEVDVQADTVTEHVTRYGNDGNIFGTITYKFLKNGALVESIDHSYNSNDLTDTNSFQWNKYLVTSNENGVTTDYVRLYYNMQTRLFDTIATEYAGFNDGLSYQTIISKDHPYGHSCGNIVPSNITRYFNSEKSVCTNDSTTLSETICQGVDYEGFESTGIYYLTKQNISGCDSIITLNLTVLSNDTTFTTQSICYGESFRGYEQTGKYTETFSSINGCDSLVITDLTVTDIPVIDLGKDTTIYTNETIVLDAGIFQSYSWSTTESTQTITINGQDYSDGSSEEVSLLVTDANACSGSDTIILSFEVENELNNPESTLSYVKVFPNPSLGDIVIELPEHSSNVTIILMSETGAIIERYSSALNNITGNTIEIKDLQTGFYNLYIENSSEIFNQHIIVQ